MEREVLEKKTKGESYQIQSQVISNKNGQEKEEGKLLGNRSGGWQFQN